MSKATLRERLVEGLDKALARGDIDMIHYVAFYYDID